MFITNRERIIATQVIAQISHPTLKASGGFFGGFATTWDGKSKIAFGPGGIKYNVKIGSPCFGWPETENLEPEVALKGVDGPPASLGQSPGSTTILLNTVACIGNEATVIGGDARGEKGVIIGKTESSVLAHFSTETLDKLSCGDRVRIIAEGVGTEIDGFDGDVYNMSPSFLEAIARQEKDSLVLPVAKVVPAYAMGWGVGGSEAWRGTLNIQSCPPSLVEEIGISDLKIGDIVACKDTIMSYGKGFYKGAITVGVVTTGASDNAGHGPEVMALASSIKGKIVLEQDSSANIAKYLKLE